MRKKVGMALLAILVGLASASSSPALDNSLARVKKRGVLRIGADPGELPWFSIDTKTGRYIGFEAELAELLAERLGLRLEVVSTPWDYLSQGLVEKKYDIILNAWTPTPETEEKIAPSVPYLHWGLMIVVRKGNTTIRSKEDLKGKVVGIYVDPLAEAFARTLGAKAIKSFESGYYNALKEGRIDAFLYDSVAVLYAAKHDPAIKVVGEPLTRSTYHIGVRKEDQALFDAVNSALKVILQGKEYASIIKRWQ